MRLYTWNGKLMSLPEICEMEDIAYSTTASLLRYGDRDIQEAVEKAKAVRTYRHPAYSWNGTQYTNLETLAKAAGLCYKTLRKHMGKGMTIDEAVKAAQNAKADHSKNWRKSVLLRSEEKKRKNNATEVERIFLYIMGTCKTEAFNFRRVGENKYVWQGDVLMHSLTVSKSGSEYIARFKSNDAIVCRRTIV